MKRRRRFESFGAGVIAGALVFGGVGLAAPAAAAPGDIVESVDFTDLTTGSWESSGDSTLDFLEVDGNTALLVQNRVNDYDGIQTAAGALSDIEPGEYTFSMRTRLAEAQAAPVATRFVVKPTYTWVGSSTMTADDWTTVTGEFTIGSDDDRSELQIYIGTGDLDPAAAYDYLIDDVLITGPNTVVEEPGDGGEEPGEPTDPEIPESLSFDFEDGLQGWAPRGDADGDPTVEVTTAEAYAGTSAALVSDRNGQGDGIGLDVTDLLVAGTTYELSAWVKFGAGQPADAVWLSRARTNAGAQSFDTIAQFAGVTASGWTQVTTSFPATAADAALLYFETNYNGTNTSDLLIDNVTITAQVPSEIQDITPILDTLDVPVGVAIDSRETSGPAAELVTRHFNQLTSENYMKPEAWYTADREFVAHPEVDALMSFAVENDLDVYGHTLVWHSQTPAWFFDDESGADLTDSEEDQAILRERMRTHIFAVAESLSQYGEFGGENPITAFDVVNEVVSDGGENPDGLRRSEWFRILGEDFIDLAFQYADEAFNGEYAAEGSDRPVTLFINDYNTEQDGKQQRLLALVERMIERDVAFDGVGHQFHLSLATPIASLEQAISAFTGLGLTQAVTEFDVTTGTPETEAKFIEQGYFYRDAFRIFRDNIDELFSVTVWGLTDGRSWRAANGGPLVFDNALQAKPAYYGIVDGELPDRLRTANVFAGSLPIDDAAIESPIWDRLPLNLVEDVAGFQLRWGPEYLTAYVEVTDTTVDATDGVEFELDGVTYTVARDGSGDIDAVVEETDGGYTVVARVPAPGEAPADFAVLAVAEGDTVEFDLRVTDGTVVAGWNSPGAVGTLTLIEGLSFVEVIEADDAPTVDAAIEDAWATAETVSTDKLIEGAVGATSVIRTLWNGSTLYVLAEVTDPTVDVSGSDPWIQDSLEIFVDAGNFKNGSFRYDDTQIRISAENVVSFGTGDEAFQANRVESATTAVEGGYVVEASISLLESGGEGTFQGLDFQLNDASNGARTGVTSWADPTGTGYQSTARWGVGELVSAAAIDPVDPVDPGTPVTPGTPGDGGTGGSGDDNGTGTGSGTAGSGVSGADRDVLGMTGANALPFGLLGLLLLALGAFLVSRRSIAAKRAAAATPID